MKRNSIFLILFIGGILIFYQNAFAVNADSLKFEYLHELSHTKQGDKKRLEILNEISRIVKDTQTELYYIDKLLHEAREQKNTEYICKAYYARLVVAHNTLDWKEANKWYNMLEPIARKDRLYEIMFRGKRAVIDLLNITGDYEEEEKEALKMLEEARELNSDVGMMLAYQCLSPAYRSTFRNKEAIEALEKAYNIAYRIQDISLVEINHLLIGAYQSLGDRPNLLKWIKNMDTYLQRIIREDPSLNAEYEGWILLTYLAYLTYYTEAKDLDRAAYYLGLAEKYRMIGYGAYEHYYFIARHKYFLEAKMYNEALVEADQMIELYAEFSPGSYGIINFKKAFLLEKMGRIDDALSLYKRSFYLIDSLQVVTLNKQTELLKKDYDTDQLMLKKERIQSDIQILFLFLVVMIVIILVCYVIHAYRIRTGLRKSEEEMREMAEEMEQANVAKEVFLSTISASISVPLNSVVSGSLKLASDEELSMSERQSISESLNKTSAELLDLINNILNLSRLEAGMMKFKTERIDIIPFMQGMTTLMQSKGKKIGLLLPDSHRELKIEADIMHLQEIFNRALLGDGDESTEIIMEVMDDNATLKIEIHGTCLTSVKPSQEIAIANEVNRLLMENFGGEYIVNDSYNKKLSALYLKFPLM